MKFDGECTVNESGPLHGQRFCIEKEPRILSSGQPFVIPSATIVKVAFHRMDSRIKKPDLRGCPVPKVRESFAGVNPSDGRKDTETLGRVPVLGSKGPCRLRETCR